MLPAVEVDLVGRQGAGSGLVQQAGAEIALLGVAAVVWGRNGFR